MIFCDKSVVRRAIAGKSVAIVGSGPGCMENEPGFIDSHDVVVRVNNFKLFPETGFRTDIFYSFFGVSIKKTIAELDLSGVKLCICKCPNEKFIESEWHRRNHKMNGVDFRYIYRNRAKWWFCDTYVPTHAEFMAQFELLNQHIPTTGFSAILEVLSHAPASVYLTGFDFFTSAKHNVNEKWRRKNTDDPIGHAPELECKWLAENISLHPITTDVTLRAALAKTA